MTMRELAQRLTAIADEAALSEETRPAAGVLYGLLGAIHTDDQAVRRLLQHTSELSAAELRGLQSRDN